MGSLIKFAIAWKNNTMKDIKSYYVDGKNIINCIPNINMGDSLMVDGVGYKVMSKHINFDTDTLLFIIA